MTNAPSSQVAANILAALEHEPAEIDWAAPELDPAEWLDAVIAGEIDYQPAPVDPVDHFFDQPTFPRPGSRAMRADDLERLASIVDRSTRMSATILKTIAAAPGGAKWRL